MTVDYRECKQIVAYHDELHRLNDKYTHPPRWWFVRVADKFISFLEKKFC